MRTMEKAVYLISGGIDSPVAAYLGIKRGWHPVFVHFDNFPFTDAASKDKALKIISHIMNVTGIDGEVLLVPHGKDLETIVQNCKRNLSCILCKRMMYRKADAIAKKYGCDGIVTGEIIGEQASQTIRNLILNSKVVKTPIIRPLLGMNKLEVEQLAKRIGTYDLSISPSKPCAAAAIRARTHANEIEVSKEENKIPVQSLLEDSLKNAIYLKKL